MSERASAETIETTPDPETQEAFWDLTERIFYLVGERGKALRICQRSVASLGFAPERQIAAVRALGVELDEAKAAFDEFTAANPGASFVLHRPDVAALLDPRGRRLPTRSATTGAERAIEPSPRRDPARRD